MMERREWYRSAIEAELARVGAKTWMYVGYRSAFKANDFDNDLEAELSSLEYGGLVRPAPEIALVLSKLSDNAGDEAITTAFFDAPEDWWRTMAYHLHDDLMSVLDYVPDEVVNKLNSLGDWAFR